MDCTSSLCDFADLAAVRDFTGYLGYLVEVKGSLCRAYEGIMSLAFFNADAMGMQITWDDGAGTLRGSALAAQAKSRAAHPASSSFPPAAAVAAQAKNAEQHIQLPARFLLPQRRYLRCCLCRHRRLSNMCVHVNITKCTSFHLRTFNI